MTAPIGQNYDLYNFDFQPIQRISTSWSGGGSRNPMTVPGIIGHKNTTCSFFHVTKHTIKFTPHIFFQTIDWSFVLRR